ncbi:conserved hypothetical protein [Desulforapulum autotrophicum HRM2]|uniref:RCK N-terminal domain-containing protein n=1 Tax=Desulforapulum autotrophicum (strain ATCC 43914 / DSM 3382 / VKM B-1955 / HRM2) TaxID=177437 RepID=C0QFU0_DESAH|nr:NAD-binding protein [Desulforapulum autotrophicum]ACN15508.1 conserved hypothetical protein [Desulforapulum autotrophicum HRM2]
MGEMVLIVGAGKFGRKAAQRLREQMPETTIIAVDQNFSDCKKIAVLGAHTVCADGVWFLDQLLHKNRERISWIVPCVPIHLSWEWVRLNLPGDRQVHPCPPPPEVIDMLPNPMEGDEGVLYMSNADFICPDNCPEPADFCTVTKKPRPRILYQSLGSIKIPGWQSIVVRSHQLAPGVGGYTPEALYNALSCIKTEKTSVLFSTACACHGVMMASEIWPKNPF